jgi:hypothetical protein
VVLEVLAGKVTRLLWLDLAAWFLTLADVLVRLPDRAPGSAFDAGLGVLGLFALGAGIARSRAFLVPLAAVYLGYYALRLYFLEVEPLLAIMSLPRALADTLYVMWSSPAGRLAQGEFAAACAELFRQCLMPLMQVAVLLGRPDNRSATSG